VTSAPSPSRLFCVPSRCWCLGNSRCYPAVFMGAPNLHQCTPGLAYFLYLVSTMILAASEASKGIVCP
jgi:hypothetical protein